MYRFDNLTIYFINNILIFRFPYILHSYNSRVFVNYDIGANNTVPSLKKKSIKKDETGNLRL